MRRWVKIGVALLAVALAAAIAALLVARSDWFREKLRQRIVAELEKATGGRAEIGSLDFDAGRRHAKLENISVHGTEAPGEKPLFHATALEVDLRIVSFLKRQVDVAALRVVAPEIRIRLDPEGASNIPSPVGKKAPGRVFTEDLLDLAVGRFEVERGELWWNDRRYALEVRVSDLRTRARLEKGSYAGRLEAGRTVFSSLPRLPAIDHVAASFRVMRDRIEIGELAAKTAMSEWKSHGAITELAQPRWELQYEAELDARDGAAAIPLQQLKAGRVQLRGSFDAARGDWKTAGKLSARKLAVSAKEFRVDDFGVTGDYRLDPRELLVESLAVRLLGGQWQGRLRANTPGRDRPMRAALEGRAEGVRLEAVAAALATPARPLTELGWTALIRGPLNLVTVFPPSVRDLSVQGDLVFEAPGETGGLTALQGALRGSYNGRASEIQLSEARLATPATAVSAFGRIRHDGGSNLQFRLQTARLEDLTRAATAFSGAKIEAPGRLDGKAVAQGRILGTLEQPEVDATIDVGRFAYQGRDWDSLTGRLQWSPQRLRLLAGRLTKDKTVVGANLTARLEDGRLTENSPLEAEISIRDTPLQDLAALAGTKVAVTGAVTAALKLQGTQKNPRGSGRVEVRRGEAWGEPFDSFRAALVLDSGEVKLSNAQITRLKNVITGQAAFHPERRTFRFDARGANLALSSLKLLSRSGRKLTGAGSFEIAGSGRLSRAGAAPEELAIEGELRLRKLAVDNELLGDVSASARREAGKLQVAIQSNFAGARIEANANVLPRDRFPVEGRVEFRGLDVSSALRAAGVGDVRAEISADGSLAVQGEIPQPEKFTGSGDLTRLEMRWPEKQSNGATPPKSLWTLRNAEPMKWRLADRKLSFEPFRLVGEGSDLRASGWADLDSKGAVNAAVDGNLNLATLGAMVTKLAVGGVANLNAVVTGTHSQPAVNGRLEIRDASLGTEDLPVSISKANGLVRFSGQGATIQKLTAEVGGGEVGISGDAQFSGGPLSYRLRAEGRQVRLRYPRGLSTLLEGELSLAGTGQQSVLGGEIRIMRAGTRAAVELGELLATLKEPARTPSRNDWLQGAQLNVNIVSAPDIRFETPRARNLQADANLHLQGNALNPALLGRINLTQGEFQFEGTRFTINRGDVTFSNPFRIEPILNLDLETRVSAYDISLTLAGPLEKLNVSYRSDPPLPFNEVVTLLAVGRTPTIDPTLAAQQSLQARSLTQLEASTVVGQVIAKPVSGRLQRFFGVSRLKLDPEITGPEGNPNARVTLEQQVGRDITFTYVYNLASAQQQIVRVQWAISKQLSLIAVRDQNGIFGLDFLYKKRYR